MHELSYLQEPGFTITSARVEIAGQTFATDHIDSVEVAAPHLSIAGVLIGLAGLASMFFGVEVLGLCLAVGGSLWVLATFNMRKLSLVGDSGAVLTLQSSDAAMIERVKCAIAKAIAVG